jgi:sugar O-acyltransferase (sialic acid O-acetyltransferase NeuD family)
MVSNLCPDNPGDQLYLFGAGGHAKVVIATLRVIGCRVQGLYEDDEQKWSRRLCDIPIVASLAPDNVSGDQVAIIAIGNNATRKAIAKRYPAMNWATAIHPNADVHPSACLGAGTVVFSGAVVQPDATLGRHCIINTGATVDHDCVIADYVHLAPGVHLAGNVKIGEGALLGIGSVAIPGVNIGAWSIVGAGAVITQDVPTNATVAGVPARPIKTQNNVPTCKRSNV